MRSGKSGEATTLTERAGRHVGGERSGGPTRAASRGQLRACLVIAVAVAALSAASSASACEYFSHHDFVGIETKEISTNGAEAYIARYNPRTCSSSVVWPMITKVGYADQLAQDGWAKEESVSPSTVYYFTEWGDAGKLEPPVLHEAVPNPTEHGVFDHYAVYTKNASEVIFSVNEKTIAKATINWTPNLVQYYAELEAVEDQVPGDTSYHEEFYGLKHLYNGSWYSDNAKGNYHVVEDPYGGAEWGEGNYFFIWDNRYSSEY